MEDIFTKHIHDTLEKFEKDIKQIEDALDKMDTETVDKLGIYECRIDDANPSRYLFFRIRNIMCHMDHYFNDELWAKWKPFRDEKLGLEKGGRDA